jgi:DNA-binding MarR family transcriptional regulator
MSSSGTPTTAGRKTTRRRSAQRFEVLNAFVDGGMADLSRAELAVWLCLFRDTRQPDSIARTAVKDIARRAGIDRRTVLRALKQLEARRMLQVVRRGGLNRGPSSYRVFPYPME